MIYSFDIFDTLITRITGTPDGVFSIMQHTLEKNDAYSSFPKPLREDFWHARTNLEQEKRNYSDNEDITIIDIYDFISDVFDLSLKQKNQLMNLEIETEISVMVGIQDNISKLKHLIKQGKQVILVSDMYLRKSDVVKILDSIDPFITKHCEIFLSSEINKTKHRGTLFDHIIKKYNIDPSEIIHTGDNDFSDIHRARRKKIKTIHYKGAKANYYEDLAVKQKLNNIGIQIMVGISKLARMKLKTDLEKISCSLAGPWICTFVKWVLESAKKSGINRLYFLSRDGELLMQVAERLIRSNQTYSDLELQYLCVSRQSAVYPSIEKFDQRAIDHILQKHPYLSVEMIAQRTYTPKNILIDFFKKKYKINLDGSQIGNRHFARIAKIFKNDAELEKLILTHRDEKKDLILNYLTQEGLFDTDTIALVDVGWLCTIQDALYNIIKTSKYSNKKIIGYYFGVTKYSNDTDKNNQKIPFTFHSFSPAHVYNKPYYVIWMELFCSSNLGITLDYAFDGEKIIINKLPSKTNKYKWINQIREGIFAYTETFMQFEKYSNLDFSKDQNCYMTVYYNPDKKLAECIGKLYYSADPLDSDLREFAPKFTSLNFYKPGFSKWFEGSMKRSNIILRYIIIKAINLKHKINHLLFISTNFAKRLLWKSAQL